MSAAIDLAASTIPASNTPAVEGAPEPARKMAFICSKGSLDMVYPALIMANAARMSGVDAMIFFTFWGLDAITESKVDNLHVATVGNPSMHLPTMVGGLPGMEGFATKRMKKEMAQLDLPSVREMIQILSDSGAKLYGCKLAMDMFKLQKKDLLAQVDDVISAMDFVDMSAGAQIVFV
jgi:peroxiredoxin family protein